MNAPKSPVPIELTLPWYQRWSWLSIMSVGMMWPLFQVSDIVLWITSAPGTEWMAFSPYGSVSHMLWAGTGTLLVNLVWMPVTVTLIAAFLCQIWKNNPVYRFRSIVLAALLLSFLLLSLGVVNPRTSAEVFLLRFGFPIPVHAERVRAWHSTGSIPAGLVPKLDVYRMNLSVESQQEIIREEEGELVDEDMPLMNGWKECFETASGRGFLSGSTSDYTVYFLKSERYASAYMRYFAIRPGTSEIVFLTYTSAR